MQSLENIFNEDLSFIKTTYFNIDKKDLKFIDGKYYGFVYKETPPPQYNEPNICDPLYPETYFTRETGSIGEATITIFEIKLSEINQYELEVNTALQKARKMPMKPGNTLIILKDNQSENYTMLRKKIEILITNIYRNNEKTLYYHHE